jgi:hypothetical protein
MADQGALDVLDGKLRKVAQQNVGPTENVRAALKGNSGQALLALDDRLVILKAGLMVGATLGGKATSFPYGQVSAIELKAGPLNAVLQIHSSAFQANQVGSYWTSDKKHDPWKLPNCITAPSASAKEWQPYLDAIRTRIARGAWPRGSATPSSVDANVLIRRIDPAREGAVLDVVWSQGADPVRSRPGAQGA